MASLTRAEQKALRPTQILEAAFQEFVDHGFTAARVEDIAERVGVTKGTVYVYFPTKDELFSAMIQYIAVPMKNVIGDIGELKGNAATRLETLLRELYHRLLRERRLRQLLRFVVAEGARFPEVIDTHRDELIEPIHARIQSILDEGVEAGEFVGGPRANACLIFAPIVAIGIETLIYEDRRELDLESYIDAHIDLVIGSLLVDRNSRS